MSSKFVAFVSIIILTASIGCLPSTRIVKNPLDRDQGLRYYRPKPYLFIKPLVNRAGEPVSGFVTMEQAVLPDFSEEYSIHIRTGLGSNRTSVTLTDGWRLDSLNVQIDSNFDDNLEAIADVAKAVPSLTAGSDSPTMAVKATNVPLGYYESVIVEDCDGKKQLRGFRYVGFMPYGSGPIQTIGVGPMSELDDLVFGLVFEDNTMVFKPLDSMIDHVDLTRFDTAKETAVELIEDDFDASLLEDEPVFLP